MIRMSLAMLRARGAWSSLDRTATSGRPFKIFFGCHVLNLKEMDSHGSIHAAGPEAAGALQRGLHHQTGLESLSRNTVQRPLK